LPGAAGSEAATRTVSPGPRNTWGDYRGAVRLHQSSNLTFTFTYWGLLMARKYNQLTNTEMYQPTKLVEEFDGCKAFDTWDDVSGAFCELMERKITKPNIESAAKNCGLDLNNVLSLSAKNHPFAHMMAKVSELQAEMRSNEAATRKVVIDIVVRLRKLEEMEKSNG